MLEVWNPVHIRFYRDEMQRLCDEMQRLCDEMQRIVICVVYYFYILILVVTNNIFIILHGVLMQRLCDKM